jgi:hypothetical protein
LLVGDYVNDIEMIAPVFGLSVDSF